MTFFINVTEFIIDKLKPKRKPSNKILKLQFVLKQGYAKLIN